jgi:hypothetical protein
MYVRLIHVERVQEPEGVYDNVALSSDDALAIIVDPRSPFPVVFTD